MGINLEVEGEHEYLVGEAGVRAHNSCTRVKPRLENGDIKEGWQHILERHIDGTAARGAGDLLQLVPLGLKLRRLPIS